MVSGGDIDKVALLESFSKIKEDILRLNQELYSLKQEHKLTLEENLNLKKTVSAKIMDDDDIARIVQETMKQMQRKTKNSFSESMAQKLNKKRKNILKNRIEILAEQKNLSLPEIKEILVDQEGLCSKATFYRYIEKMKKKGMIDFMKIDDIEVVVKVN